MNTQDWLNDFTQRLQIVDDDIVSSVLLKVVEEYNKMTAMSPDMHLWFNEFSPDHNRHLLTLSTALELRIRSHQESGEMMLTPHLMVLMFTCKGITDPSLTADVVKLWDLLKKRGRKHIQSIESVTGEGIPATTAIDARTFEPSALYHRIQPTFARTTKGAEFRNPNQFKNDNATQTLHDPASTEDEQFTSSKLLLIPVALCCLGILPMPYDFYLLLRVLLCASAALVAYYDFRSGDEGWVVFAVVAALFNPFVPVYLNKPIWVLIDLAVAGLFYWRYQKSSSSN